MLAFFLLALNNTAAAAPLDAATYYIGSSETVRNIQTIQHRLESSSSTHADSGRTSSWSCSADGARLACNASATAWGHWYNDRLYWEGECGGDASLDWNGNTLEVYCQSGARFTVLEGSYGKLELVAEVKASVKRQTSFAYASLPPQSSYTYGSVSGVIGIGGELGPSERQRWITGACGLSASYSTATGYSSGPGCGVGFDLNKRPGAWRR